MNNLMEMYELEEDFYSEDNECGYDSDKDRDDYLMDSLNE